MKMFLIITCAILWVGYKAYKSVRKNFADPEEGTDNTQHTDAPRPAFESLFSDEEPDEAPERSFAQRDDEAPLTFEDEEKAAGYYTYESTEAEKAEPAREQELQAAMVAGDAEAAEAQRAFDLRQAVIYQTILNNKYNPELSIS